MDRANAPLERRYFETREQEQQYIAAARGFGNVVEMRDYFNAHGTPAEHSGRAAETGSGVNRLELRLRLRKMGV